MDNNTNTDDIKGRAKEAVGAATDNEDLKNEGRIDQAKGDVKQKVSDAADWVGDKLTEATNKDK